MVLETYLKELLQQPVLVHKKVLEFLNISENHKKPFLAYFRYVWMQNERGRKRMKRLADLDEREETEQSAQSDSPRETGPMKRIEYYSYQFEVACLDYERLMSSTSYEYVFQVSNLTKTPRQSWRVMYTYP